MSSMFSKENIFMSILLSGMAWGAIAITELKASTAVNSSFTNKFENVIPKIDNNLTEIKTDLKYMKRDVDVIKQSQKSYQVDFNNRLDALK